MPTQTRLRPTADLGADEFAASSERRPRWRMARDESSERVRPGDPHRTATAGRRSRPGWDIGGNANGGYLLALAASHLRAVAGRPDPITVTATTCRPGTPGRCRSTPSRSSPASGSATLSGTMHRDGRPMLQVLGTFGDIVARRRRVRDRPLRRRRSCRRSTSASARRRDQGAWSSADDGPARRPPAAARTPGSPAGIRVRCRPRWPAGSRSPTAGRSTRWRCCSSATRCRRRCSTSTCPPGGCRPSSTPCTSAAFPAPGPVRCVFRTQRRQRRVPGGGRRGVGHPRTASSR